MIKKYIHFYLSNDVFNDISYNIGDNFILCVVYHTKHPKM